MGSGAWTGRSEKEEKAAANAGAGTDLQNRGQRPSGSDPDELR